MLVTWLLTTLREAGWAPLAVFAVHTVAAVVFHAYAKYPLLDVPMHFLGGLVIAYFFHRAIVNASRFGFPDLDYDAVRCLLVFSLVCTAAVFWEFAEWIWDRLFQTHHQTSLDDTMLDLALGIGGGAVFLALSARNRKTANPPTM